MLHISKFFCLSRCFTVAFSLYLLGFAGIASCDAQQNTAPSGGNQYKQLKVNEQLKSDRSDVGRMLRDGIPGGSGEKFDTYYKEYVFPQWTLAKNHHDLPKERKSLQSDFNGARNAEAFNRLLGLALENLTPLATSPEFHPAVRFNAAVMLGRLNSTATAPRESPKAYPKALPILIKILSNDNDVDAARFGALLGIVRHAEFNLDEASRPAIIDALIQQASLAKPPVGRTNAGHEWFRSTAIEGLEHAKGEEINKAAQALAKIVNSPTEPNSIRRKAAASLGKLTLTPESGVNVSTTVRSLVELASKAVQEEVEACEKDETKIMDPVLLKTSLLPVLVALTGQEKSVSSPSNGLAAAAKDDNGKQFLSKAWKPINDWYEMIDKKKELVPIETENTQTGMGPGMMGPGMMGGGMMGSGQQKTPARLATEELIEYFNLELKKMENLLGGGTAGN